MKEKLAVLFSILLLVFVFTSCEDRTELTAPTPPSPNTGAVNFTNFVSIGNSLTAGYQSGALFESAQVYSFGNLIAKQVGASYVQPIVSDPGLGSPGRIEVKSLNPFALTYNLTAGGLTNPTYASAYNNLGIPGIVLADVLTSASSATSFSKSPFIDLVLRGKGTVLAQAATLNPTFITVWIGNNDVLGYATSGGAKPTSPTDPQVFAGLYAQLGDALAATGAKVVVANIPCVTCIPFFTTVGPGLAQALSAKGAPGMYIQLHGQYNGTAIPLSYLADKTAMITLPGSNYTSYIGLPGGKFYKDNNVDISPLIAGGILDTTQLFGLHPKNPWPDALVLDPTEVATAINAINAYNASIASVASSKGFALNDINGFFIQIRNADATGGYSFNGLKLSTTYVTGGIFSLDGIHPTNQGHAIVANEFIKTINAKWSTSISLINVSQIPGSIILAKKGYLGIPIFDKGTLDNLFF